MMFPSVSLNHAALAPPAVKMPFSSVSGMSYFSNFTPRAFSSATSRSMFYDPAERLARLGGAGVRRRVEEARGTFAELVDYPLSPAWLEAQLLLIEFTRAGNVLPKLTENRRVFNARLAL